jgi:hypothetical protein
MHPNLDQSSPEQGEGIVMMGKTKTCLKFRKMFLRVPPSSFPAGTWHNLINTGNKTIKLYLESTRRHSIPPAPIHCTKADSDETEE